MRTARTNDRLLRVNEALVHSVDRYLTLDDLAPTPMMTVDPDGEITEVNDAAVILAGVFSRGRRGAA